MVFVFVAIPTLILGSRLTSLGERPPPVDQASHAPAQDTLAWERIKDSNDPSDFKQFAERFPLSPHAPAANSRYYRLLADRNARDRFRDEYETRFPVDRAMPADNEVVEQHEHALWEAARQADSESLLRQYVSRYPEGEYIALAEAKLRGLLLRETEAIPPPPPPPAPNVPAIEPAPSPAEPFTLTLFPTLDAQAEALVGETVEVLVALTEDQLTPDVDVRPSRDTAVTTDGALELRDLPASEDGWLMDVDLVAPGFDLEGGGEWIEQMQVYPYGDSDYLRFRLRARPISGDAREVRIKARFVLDGRYLGSVSRPITILRQRPAETFGTTTAASLSAPVDTMASRVIGTSALVHQPEVPDLTVMMDYEDPARLGAAVMSFYSPHFAPVRAEVHTSPDITDWLALRMGQLAHLSVTRGATPMQGAAAGQPQSREMVEATVAGIGRELYRNYVPEPFKEAFWRLKSQDRLRSIQITTNNTALPWEIVLPVGPDGSFQDEYLGVGYRLARWALRDSVGQDDVPRDSLAMEGIAAIAPPYEGGAFLPFQQREVEAISRIAGFRKMGGDFASVRQMLSGSPQSFVHFSGHGQVSDSIADAPVFAIRLTDALLEPSTWQAMTMPPFLGQGTFYFFNACDIGGSSTYAGFLQGWGPALLQSGASGFIGGMWPLPDRSAADFSSEFYALLGERLGEGPAHVADVLRQVRARFYETGDPTYLAYSYYGNANLTITAP